MDFDSLTKAGSMLGSAGVVVMDESVCMVRMAVITARFYAHESCGQCTQCREGTHWLYKILHSIEDGHGRMQDLDTLLNICDNMKGRTICVLSDAAAMPTEAFINKFRAEFEQHITGKACPLLPTPQFAAAD
jgi:NADH-quinone oxidoreductase subunit F